MKALHPATLTFISPTFSGTVSIAVGGSRWRVPPGSRVAHHPPENTEVVFVLDPEGELRALTEQDGQVREILFPTDFVRDEAARKFFPGASIRV